MGSTGGSGLIRAGFIACAILISTLVTRTKAADIFLEWNVALDTTLQPMSRDTPV